MEFSNTVEKVINVDIVVEITYTIDKNGNEVEIRAVVMRDRSGKAVDVEHLMDVVTTQDFIADVLEDEANQAAGEWDDND